MALKLNLGSVHDLPQSLEGSYLFPYEWFQYGIDNGHIEIEDLSFYDTIQGSIYLAVDDADAPNNYDLDDYGINLPVWYLYQSGSGEIIPTVGCAILNRDRRSITIEDQYLKSPLIYISLDELSLMSKNEQKTVNNSIIQLFKGCRVKLKHSVWF